MALSFERLQLGLWRRLLKLGGRAPRDVTIELMGNECCTIEWRVRRVGPLLRLLNSPPDSWQHVALMSFILTASSWYLAALSDLRLVLPDVDLKVEEAYPMVYSTESWHNGRGQCAQPLNLQRNELGLLSRTPLNRSTIKQSEIQIVRSQIRKITRRVRESLVHTAKLEIQQRLRDHANAHVYSKASLTAAMLDTFGPALSIVFAWIEIPCHLAAISSLFSGDFFLGRYAGNYFAKPILPSHARYKARLTNLGIEASRICLHCWQTERTLLLEDEAHIIFECGLYERQRRDFQVELSGNTQQYISIAPDATDRLKLLLRSWAPGDWQSLGKFLARARQVRRRARANFQRMAEQQERNCFEEHKRIWRREGRTVCRHGVFFNTTEAIDCPCLMPRQEADWRLAMLMPVLNEETKNIEVDTFEVHSFQRLGCLQVELRRRGW